MSAKKAAKPARTPTKMVRNVSPELMQMFSERAETEGRTHQFVMVRLMDLYARAGLEALESAAPKGKK